MWMVSCQDLQILGCRSHRVLESDFSMQDSKICCWVFLQFLAEKFVALGFGTTLKSAAQWPCFARLKPTWELLCVTSGSFFINILVLDGGSSVGGFSAAEAKNRWTVDLEALQIQVLGSRVNLKKHKKQPFHGISYGDSEIKLCQPMLQCPQWAEYALLAVEWEKPHSQPKIPLMPAILNRLSSRQDPSWSNLCSVHQYDQATHGFFTDPWHGFFDSRSSLCHRTLLHGSPFQRVDAGTATAKRLGTRSGVKSPACVTDRSRTLLEPNALCVNFTASQVKRPLQVKDIYRYQSWPMKR